MSTHFITMRKTIFTENPLETVYMPGWKPFQNVNHLRLLHVQILFALLPKWKKYEYKQIFTGLSSNEIPLINNIDFDAYFCIIHPKS